MERWVTVLPGSMRHADSLLDEPGDADALPREAEVEAGRVGAGAVADAGGRPVPDVPEPDDGADGRVDGSGADAEDGTADGDAAP